MRVHNHRMGSSQRNLFTSLTILMHLCNKETGNDITGSAVNQSRKFWSIPASSRINWSMSRSREGSQVVTKCTFFRQIHCPLLAAVAIASDAFSVSSDPIAISTSISGPSLLTANSSNSAVMSYAPPPSPGSKTRIGSSALVSSNIDNRLETVGNNSGNSEIIVKKFKFFLT